VTRKKYDDSGYSARFPCVEIQNADIIDDEVTYCFTSLVKRYEPSLLIIAILKQDRKFGEID